MELSFEDFKKRATDNSLSRWEKIGFPDSYRKDSEEMIFSDISLKTNITKKDTKVILDIGCGCSDLVDNLIKYCTSTKKELYLNDSEEMLSNIDLTNDKLINLIPGKFPKQVLSQIENKKFDLIVLYSVIQYIYNDQNIHSFIHECMTLLNPGGQLFIGDIPNYDTRERFLESEEGKIFRRKHYHVDNNMNINHLREERIDDTIVISILSRFRSFGYETYLLPQENTLPMGNRREDILIQKR
ncbi:class I SAM-dependent methyltransferase [Flavobacteriaceae bacterium]|nr:class I SAM-dependent methyltransferase [Flavobacteriaceae bacterium]